MEERIIIEIDGKKEIVTKGSRIHDIITDNALAAFVDGELVELSYVLDKDCNIKLVYKTDRLGFSIYSSGLKFLYVVSVKEVLGKDVDVELKHSLDRGIYTTIDRDIDEETLLKIKNKMLDLVENEEVIQKITTTRKEALAYYEKKNETERINIYKTKTSEIVTLYSLLDYYDYFYTLMPSKCKALKDFDLVLLDKNSILLQLPEKNGTVKEYTKSNNVLHVFREYEKWANLMNMNYVSDVNKSIVDGKIKEFIQLNEMAFSREMVQICKYIDDHSDTIKVVAVAGPTSSGKTTSSKQLALYLKSRGFNPFIISLDNYFKNMVDTPKNDKGEYLFDVIEALDLDLFNDHLKRLLNNEEVVIPEYNFIKGEKEYKRDPVSIKDRDILIIEGLYAISDKITEGVDRKNVFKIYVSPFTPLRIDRHNHISSIDTRFIRILVRDSRLRGRDAIDTFEAWSQVREAEDKYIFPFQNEADVVLNTAFIYETGMLKDYALPLLERIDVESEYYYEAIRIRKFLNNFLSIPSDYLPNTSVLREFIGNGYFE